jgi:plasmid stability protein
MTKIMIENLDSSVLEVLETRASRHNRSIEIEVKEILSQVAARENLPQVASRLRELRKQIAWKNPPIRELIEEGRRF